MGLCSNGSEAAWALASEVSLQSPLTPACDDCKSNPGLPTWREGSREVNGKVSLSLSLPSRILPCANGAFFPPLGRDSFALALDLHGFSEPFLT